MDKRFWGIVGIIAAILIGLFVITGNNNKAGAPSTGKEPTNHVKGQGKANVTLIEYGDYQCPYCSQYHPIVKEVIAKYDPYIKFQFRNLPLIQLHPHAFEAARAAEAASLQNKFWEMHDLLYQNQDPSGKAGWVASSNPLDNYFVGYAKQLGLNVTKFKQDFASEKINNLINADLAAFKKTGVDMATPAFFLNGKHIQPTGEVSSFEKLLNAEIKKQTGSEPTFTSSSTKPTAPVR